MSDSWQFPDVRFSATSSSGITCYDADRIVHSYVPTAVAKAGPGSKLESSCWSPDGSFLASCVHNSDKVVLTYSKKSVFTSAEMGCPMAAPTALAFPTGSQKRLLVATKYVHRYM